MAWTVTTGTITGVAGALITMLDTELVTNRSWTKAFTGTNKAAYRNGAAAVARSYFRVLDDASNTGGARDAMIRGFYTMSDVDTGTGDFPVAADYANGFIIRKSATADATTRAYIAAGDDKTFILFVASGDVSGSYITHYFGDGDCSVPSDNSFRLLVARTTSVASSITTGSVAEAPFTLQAPYAGSTPYVNDSTMFCGYIGGASGASSGSVRFALFGFVGAYMASGNSAALAALGGMQSYPSVRGALELGDLIPATTGVHIRGRFRGLFMPVHPSSYFGDGDTFDGTDSLSGNSFRIVKNIRTWSGGAGSALSLGCVAISTNEPPSLL